VSSFAESGLMACATGPGVDSAWKQENLEATLCEMLDAKQSRTSGCALFAH